MIPQRSQQAGGSPNSQLLFLGSANAKNIHGINQFLASLAGWSSPPRLTIAGHVSKHVDLDVAARYNVTVSGYVSDLEALYAGVQGAICPVQGTGVNINLSKRSRTESPYLPTHRQSQVCRQAQKHASFPSLRLPFRRSCPIRSASKGVASCTRLCRQPMFGPPGRSCMISCEILASVFGAKRHRSCPAMISGRSEYTIRPKLLGKKSFAKMARQAGRTACRTSAGRISVRQCRRWQA